VTVYKHDRLETNGQKKSSRLAPGTHAVGAYHDETIIAVSTPILSGYPPEGYALSNWIGAVISRPRFSDAAFAFGPTKTPT